MKQNITYNQVSELSSGNIINLYEKYNLKYKDIDNGIDWFTQYKYDLSEYLTIGKMIEIINDFLSDSYSIEDSIDIEIDRTVKMSFVEFKINNKYIEFKSDELCDALWEAIKQLFNI